MQLSIFLTAALSLGTVVALPSAPVPRAEEGPIKSVLATVEHLKTVVHTEVESISSTLTSGKVDDVVPAVQASLDTIVAEVQEVVSGVIPLVVGTVGPITKGDLQIVLDIVADVKDIVGDVQAEVTEVVDVLGADTVALVEEQLKGVLDTLTPLVNPILTLAYSVVGRVSGGDVAGLVKDVLALADDLKGTVNGILAPVTGLLDGLLGGLLG
ncbi:hypothetical protein ACHAQA_008558 [Verticillium albo-atrum]